MTDYYPPHPELVVQLGADLEGFMPAAHGAYLQANPAAREEFETMHLLAQRSLAFVRTHPQGRTAGRENLLGP